MSDHAIPLFRMLWWPPHLTQSKRQNPPHDSQALCDPPAPALPHLLPHPQPPCLGHAAHLVVLSHSRNNLVSRVLHIPFPVSGMLVPDICLSLHVGLCSQVISVRPSHSVRSKIVSPPYPNICYPTYLHSCLNFLLWEILSFLKNSKMNPYLSITNQLS